MLNIIIPILSLSVFVCGLIYSSRFYRSEKVNIKNILLQAFSINEVRGIVDSIKEKNINKLFEVLPNFYMLWGIVQQLVMIGIYLLLCLFLPNYLSAVMVIVLFSMLHIPNIFLIFAVLSMESFYFIFYLLNISWLSLPLFVILSGCLHGILASLVLNLFTDREHYGFRVLFSFQKPK